MLVGELSLEGTTRPVRGALSMAISAARQEGVRGIVVPTESAGEAAVVEDIEVIPVASLSEAAGFFAGQLDIEPFPSQLDQLFQQAKQQAKRARHLWRLVRESPCRDAWPLAPVLPSNGRFSRRRLSGLRSRAV